MRIDFRIERFCPHCEHDSLQTYLMHHAYDEKQGALWDGDPDTALEPAAYFVFTCEKCDGVLLYYFQVFDEFEFDHLWPHKHKGVESMAWDGAAIERGLQLMWPSAKVPDLSRDILAPSTPEP